MKKKKLMLKNSKLHLFVFALVVSVFGVVILFQGRAAEQNPPPPTVYLTPTDVTYAANETFSVNVRANSGTDNVNQVTAEFTYPTELLDFVDVDLANTAFETTAKNEGGNGKVTIALGTNVSTTQSVTGDQFVAKVTFRTKTQSGTANLAFTPETTLYRVPDFVNLVSDVSRNIGATFSVDTSAPSVSIASPANNAAVGKGETIPIQVNAVDDSQVSSVDIYINGLSVVTLNSEPFTYSWNTSNETLGDHEIRAVARDNFGNEGTSETITVRVVDNSKPTVTITKPSNGTKLAGPTELIATATDNPGGSGISKVEFYVNNEMVGSPVTASPYSINWDTTNIPDGVYAITARAYDNANPANVETSEAVSVTVENNDNEKPSQPTNFRSTDTKLDSITLNWNASTDNVGVVGYRITRNGSIITVTDRLTFTDTGLDYNTVYNYTIMAIDAAGNSSDPQQLSVPTNELKIGDFNRDEVVNLDDLALLIWNWKKPNPDIDLNNNGIVDEPDLSMFLYYYPRG